MKMNQITGWVRRVYGAGLVVIGLNHFFHFFATPTYAGKAGVVYQAFALAEYVLPSVGVVMLLAGTALLLNRWVKAGLLLLAPVFVNMLLFHLFLAPAGIGPALVLTSIGLYLLRNQRIGQPLTLTDHLTVR